MAGPQFFRIQSFSRKANPAGQSVDQVLAEAARVAEYCLHVADPLPPRIVLGLSPQAVLAAHDAMVAAGGVAVTLADGSVKRRGVRKDRHTLMTCIASHPNLSTQLANDPAVKADYDAWVERNLRFFRAKFGDRLVSVVEHLDEQHPHLHAFVLPSDDEGCSARDLNPAWQAKAAAEAAAKAAGRDARAAVKLGDAEYRERARALQDEYHEAVGVASALTRTGPKRERLSRAQWRARKNAATHEAEVRAHLEARVADLVAGKEDLERSMVEVAERLASKLDEADAIYAAAEAEKAEAAGLRHRAEVALLAQERSAAALWAAAEEEARKIRWVARQEADAVGRELDDLRETFETEKVETMRTAAAEAARVAVRVIAGIVTGDVVIKPDGSGWVVRDAALRERVVALKLADVLRDAVVAVSRLWDRMKARLSAGDLAAERSRVVEVVREFEHPTPRRGKGIEP